MTAQKPEAGSIQLVNNSKRTFEFGTRAEPRALKPKESAMFPADQAAMLLKMYPGQLVNHETLMKDFTAAPVVDITTAPTSGKLPDAAAMARAVKEAEDAEKAAAKAAAAKKNPAPGGEAPPV